MRLKENEIISDSMRGMRVYNDNLEQYLNSGVMK
jgi:hypothetical protein